MRYWRRTSVEQIIFSVAEGNAITTAHHSISWRGRAVAEGTTQSLAHHHLPVAPASCYSAKVRSFLFLIKDGSALVTFEVHYHAFSSHVDSVRAFYRLAFPAIEFGDPLHRHSGVRRGGRLLYDCVLITVSLAIAYIERNCPAIDRLGLRGILLRVRSTCSGWACIHPLPYLSALR